MLNYIISYLYTENKKLQRKKEKIIITWKPKRINNPQYNKSLQYNINIAPSGPSVPSCRVLSRE